jgi:hypothetical protein
MKWFDLSQEPRDGDFEEKLSKADGVVKFTNVEVQPETVDASSEEDGFSLSFNVSTPTVDRDGDTINQGGWELSDYQKNPVVLWVHDAKSPPVARSTSIFVDNANGNGGVLKSTAVFPSKDLYPFGNMIGRLYANQFMRGASVGFIPTEFEISKDRDGFHPTDFKKQKLLEWSAVPVPSNPDGLSQARSWGIDVSPMVSWAEKILDGEGILVIKEAQHLMSRQQVFQMYKDAKTGKCFFVPKGGWLELEDSEEGGAEAQSVAASQEEMLFSDDEGSVEEKEDGSILDEPAITEDEEREAQPRKEKGAISYDAAHPNGTPKAADDTAWDGPAEKSKADVEELYHMCAWYDEKEEDTKSAYKLPHHSADDYVLVWRGVTAAMASLLGARGGVDIPEENKRAVYDHLAKHYSDFGKEPPPYSDGESKADADNVDVTDDTNNDAIEDTRKDIGNLGVDIQEKCSKTVFDHKQAKQVVKAAVTEEMNALRSLICQLSGKQGEQR